MVDPVNYIIVTPVRDEEKHFPNTIQSVVSQTIRPHAWIIVDDGSTDRTGSIADSAASQHDWIHVVHRANRGFRQSGTGVIAAFYEGLARVDKVKWEFLAKLDGDLAISPDYFEYCFKHFDRMPQLGIGGGLVCRRQGGDLIADSNSDPSFHVRGATKIYRRKCWDQIGGIIKNPGWDTVDELKANMLGWKTGTFNELKLHQLKATGSADGRWRNWAKNGLANYITGYHPLFMLVKCAKRVFSRPYGFASGALAYGFVSGYLRAVPRVEDVDLIKYVRGQQLRRLTFRNSLWK